MNLPNIKYCWRCKNPYDMETNFDLCPICRGVKKLKERKGDGENK